MKILICPLHVPGFRTGFCSESAPESEKNPDYGTCKGINKSSGHQIYDQESA